ncbi:MAG: ABC transporter ATP-binding protein [Anaerolineae bacterium]|nr:ABC transporter ATP-binding protein [Anaerolineae bacterium]
MTYLRMVGITKQFPGVVANSNVDFSVEQGEIHALVGENGAGKSTLMNILYGMQQPDAGQIFLNDQPVTIPRPQAAIKLGIGMVHQHFQLVPSLTVAENVTLGYEPRRGPFIEQDKMIAQVRDLSTRFGLQINPQARVADLSVGEQQRVEILKLLHRDARLLILDEPSAVLTPQEVVDLFAVLRRLIAEGRTAIFITHKLNEVMSICQRATVLRRGKVVGTVNVADTTPEEIARMMVGHEIENVTRATRLITGESLSPRLTVRSLEATDDRGLPALRSINLTLYAGEIVGLAGVEGNGQRELVETLVGLRKPQLGDVILNDQNITALKNRQRRARRLAVIPEDRTHQGLSRSSSIMENLIATRYYGSPLSRFGWLSRQAIKDFAGRLINQFDIRAQNADTITGTLSGGNAQKVVVARELAEPPQVVVAAQPTRGLDIGAAGFVHQELFRLRDAGTAILIISADLDEILTVSDRILVIFEGRIVGELSAEEATPERLGMLMAGQTTAAPARPT